MPRNKKLSIQTATTCKAYWTSGSAAVRVGPVGARVISTSSLVLWRTLTDTYARIGLDVLGDEAFRAMVLAWIVEPTSKADSLRVLAGLGRPARIAARCLGL